MCSAQSSACGVGQDEDGIEFCLTKSAGRLVRVPLRICILYLVLGIRLLFASLSPTRVLDCFFPSKSATGPEMSVSPGGRLDRWRLAAWNGMVATGPAAPLRCGVPGQCPRELS
jgi:hypothetical protein